MKKRETVMRATFRARRAWGDLQKKIALGESIPDSYRQVIMFLFRHPGSAQRSIAEFSGVTNSAVNQTVKSMLADGYVRKEADFADGRSCKLFLTEKGEEIGKHLRQKLDHADDAITAHIGAEKEAEMILLLDDLAKFIQEELKEC